MAGFFRDFATCARAFFGVLFACPEVPVMRPSCLLLAVLVLLPVLSWSADPAQEIIALNDGSRLVGVYDEAKGTVATADGKICKVKADDVSWRAPAPTRVKKADLSLEDKKVAGPRQATEKRR
jgi:hypothetical protein